MKTKGLTQQMVCFALVSMFVPLGASAQAEGCQELAIKAAIAIESLGPVKRTVVNDVTELKAPEPNGKATYSVQLVVSKEEGAWIDYQIELVSDGRSRCYGVHSVTVSAEE